ncbi:MAG: signal peptidase II [Lachnospiraceae bacterium]|nr:signal peptidase II [Lachnospiraceae bacterium]
MKRFLTKHWLLSSLVLFAVLLLFDRVTKNWASLALRDGPVVLIEGVLEFRYLENTGAAWGTFQGMQWLFYILTVVFLAIAIAEIVRLSKKSRYLPLVYTLVVTLSGAVGNFIDRLSQRFVVDFIYFKLIDFPIFNGADCCITVSMAILVILLLFYYQNEDLDYIVPGQNAK